ncbi:SusE domain-containing protein [Persicobacter sp. CCB-QB2]|uniref:SusE domain-containing protein n=1 Tax=Persicobacter sp. CCB-QB2 TaxID=1561025 RepID=UPI0006A9F822|nr:SusE domain-containing protein [Persicobacter sp. CCB-QB2]
MKKYMIYMLSALSILSTSCKEDDHVVASDPVSPEIITDIQAENSFEITDANEQWDNVAWSDADYGLSLAVKYYVNLAVEDQSPITIAEVSRPEASTEVLNGTVNNAAIALGIAPGTTGELNIFVTSKVYNDKNDVVDGYDLSSMAKPFNVTPYAYVSPVQTSDLAGVEEELLKENAKSDWATFSWELADYGLNVSYKYTVVAHAQVNGEAAVADVKSVSGQASELTVTVEEVNRAVLALGIGADEVGQVSFTINAMVEGGEEDGIAYETLSSEASDAVSILPYLDMPMFGWKVGSRNGWDPGDQDSFRFYELEKGVYTGIHEFEAGENFKMFLPGKDWLGYAYFSGGADADFSEDGDGNLVYNGSSEVRKLVVDDNAQTIFFEEIESEDIYYKVGSENGWNDTSNPNYDQFKLYKRYDGVFEGTLDFVSGEEFKFVPEAGSWNGELSGATFPVKSPELSGDGNIEFNGSTGTYSMKMDIAAGILEVIAQ